MTSSSFLRGSINGKKGLQRFFTSLGKDPRVLREPGGLGVSWQVEDWRLWVEPWRLWVELCGLLGFSSH